MRRKTIAALLLVSPLCWGGQALPVTGDAVGERYAGSPELPDEIAYAQFLALVDGLHGEAAARDAYLHLLAGALGYRPHGTDVGRLERRGAWFRNQLRSMEAEQLESELAILCRPYGEARRSADRLYDAMNAADDIANAVRQKYLVVAMNSLSEPEKLALAEYLDEMKNGISYSRLDVRDLHADSDVDVHQLARQSCRQKEIRYGALREGRQ